MMDNYPTPAERLKEVTDKLEAGVTEVFEGGRFADYLQTMSRFHHYSFGNILLIRSLANVESCLQFDAI